MQKKTQNRKKNFLTLWPLGKGGLDLEFFLKLNFLCCCSKWVKMVPECKKTHTQNLERPRNASLFNFNAGGGFRPRNTCLAYMKDFLINCNPLFTEC